MILDGRANDREREREREITGEQDSEIVRVSVSCKNNMTERHQQASKAAKKNVSQKKTRKTSTQNSCKNAMTNIHSLSEPSSLLTEKEVTAQSAIKQKIAKRRPPKNKKKLKRKRHFAVTTFDFNVSCGAAGRAGKLKAL